ncbi:ATP-binding protein [Marichromatium gracile]|uniref:ATP-binding protein n=1 Tax=Marichromatium gracile TaxID=1048 RepID=UPI001290003B|nr:ATP-binding protein [Marichromatium gracile]
MKANPGGVLAPEDVIGRDRLIERLWSTLERQSLVLNAERRMGKTAVIKKMAAEPPEGLDVLGMDVEGLSHPNEFTERLVKGLQTSLGTTEKAKRQLGELWTRLGGTEIAGILKLPEHSRPHWKTVLEQLFAGLAEVDTGRRLVLIWDELPWMLQKIIDTEGRPAAVDLLDTLRAVRQTAPGLRMVYTGSIGLHHVLAGLRETGYPHAPLNDMRTLTVPPLAPLEATRLAAELLRGEALRVEDRQHTAALIARLVDHVPYYIHHVVATLADEDSVATPERVEQIVARALTEPQDSWQLEHFRSRLGTYYGARAGLVRAMLDTLAEHQPLSLDDLHQRLDVRHQRLTDTARRLLEGEREGLRDLVKLMQRDHYLEQDSDGRYRFALDLIRRWWQLDLGIDS